MTWIRILLLTLLIISCKSDELCDTYQCFTIDELEELTGDYVCVDNTCDVIFGFSTEGSVLVASTPDNQKYIQPDSNGYFHIYLNYNREYWPWFKLDVYATKLKKEWLINDVSFVTAAFGSNKSWVIGDSLTYTVPLYKPLGGLTTSSGQMIPEESNEITLSQFAGIEVNLVQSSSIYFREQGDFLWSRRVVGPIPHYFVGDTVTIGMEIQWREKIYKNYEQKFIIHDVNQD